MTSSARVAIVGAGLAGLSAGLDLKAAGCVVDLYERSRLLGGRATSFEVNGHEVDNGQHVFLQCCSAFREFVRRVGMEHYLHVQPRFEAHIFSRNGAANELRTASHLRAAPLPAPFHLLASFARYRHLRPAARVRVARALANAKRKPDPRDRTFAQWLARNRQDATMIRAFWDPFFLPAFNAPLDRVETQEALFVVRTAFLENADAARFGFSKVPLAKIAQAAATHLDSVHLSTAVAGVDIATGTTFCHPEEHPNGCVSKDEHIHLQLANGEQVEYDAVVLAVPPPRLVRMLGDFTRYGLEGIEKFEAFPIIDVHLWHDGGALGFDFAALLDSPVQWIFEKAPGYVCASMSAAGDYLTMSTDELIRICWNETANAIPALRSAQLTHGAVTRNPDATYLPPVGGKRPGQRTTVERVVIAGSWTATGWPDTMEAAVRSGAAAAAALLQTLQHA